MTSEQNVPEVESTRVRQCHPASRTGRRNSRRRTCSTAWGSPRAAAAVAANARTKARDAQQARQPGGDQSAGQSVASIQGSAAQPSQPQNFQASGGQQQDGPSGGGKRWKKKFRDRDRQRPRRIPATASGSSGGSATTAAVTAIATRISPATTRRLQAQRRQAAQRGPRSFVGPMDHSYRAVNGNFADTPPSTIDPTATTAAATAMAERSYQSDSQPIDYSQGRPIPIPENAPTKIFFFIEDLFFIAKIQETARKLGVKVAFVKNEKDAIAELTGGEEEDRPGLIVFDLNNANAKPLTLIPKLKAKLKSSTSIVGFLSHLQGDLKAKAVEAGCDTVMPRAAFSQNLPNLLRRYGMEEEEEPNFNQ